ncbi:SRPBCC family protein [Nocardioides panacisoli]|uniref:SRPBCC family protein n=1 Tax=Nocardioides panacisoli TaxID=627624 RepID=UPI001C6305A3|nr:SRPBCC family protein [Nocardioides panacisoli]QYJ03390.1 SRPBCC family protein [Nocardioides panacisoli]
MTTVRVRFAAPPDVVFDHLADPRRRPEWQSSLRAVEMLDEGAPRLGMRWIDKTSVGAAPTMEITRFERPRAWSESGAWRGITAELDLAFTPDGDGTMVAAEFRLTGTGPWTLPAIGLTRLAPLGIRGDLRRAARSLTGR